MKGKLGYLVNKYYWLDDEQEPIWIFKTYISSYYPEEAIKRIVYFEVDED